jgi:predicted Zn-dependent peptidase
MRILPLLVGALAGILPAVARAAPTVQQHESTNGLTVLVVEDHSLPLVTVEVAVRSGAMTEDSEHTGLSHLFESPACFTRP